MYTETDEIKPIETKRAGRIIRCALCRCYDMALLDRRCYGLCKNRLRGSNGQEKAQYGAPSVPERALFERRTEGDSPHPSQNVQSEGRDAYSARSSDVLVGAWSLDVSFVVGKLLSPPVRR